MAFFSNIRGRFVFRYRKHELKLIRQRKVRLDLGDPVDADRTATAFADLKKALKPKLEFGVVLPAPLTSLEHYKLDAIIPDADWIVATTHGFYPNADTKTTSCSSPFEYVSFIDVDFVLVSIG